MKIYSAKGKDIRQFYLISVFFDKDKSVDELRKIRNECVKAFTRFGISTNTIYGYLNRRDSREDAKQYSKIYFAFNNAQDYFMFKLKYNLEECKVTEDVQIFEDNLTLMVYEK